MASIIKFVLDHSGNPSPYYYDVPQNFAVPAAYFPSPEIVTRGESFHAYAMEYSWYVKFFHSQTTLAYEKALQALIAIKGKRNLIPLIQPDGEAAGEWLRLNDPIVSKTDDGAVQLTINWISRRPYELQECDKMQNFEVGNWMDSQLYAEKFINETMESAIEKYLSK